MCIFKIGGVWVWVCGNACAVSWRCYIVLVHIHYSDKNVYSPLKINGEYVGRGANRNAPFSKHAVI